ncbi:MAG: S-layer homology domain-containing protein, partial [Patescibacteria group bacterium]
CEPTQLACSAKLPCPSGQTKDATGQCVTSTNTNTNPAGACPNDKPIKCVDNTCAVTQLECSSLAGCSAGQTKDATGQCVQSTTTTTDPNTATGGKCPQGQFFCNSLNKCADGPTCDAGDLASGKLPPMPGQNGKLTRPPLDNAFGEVDHDKFQDEFGFNEDEFMPQEGQFMGPNLRDMQREMKRLTKDLERAQKEVERATKRGGSTSCPAVAKVTTVVTDGLAAVARISAATTAEDASAAWTYLMGTPSEFGPTDGPPPDSIFMTLYGSPDEPGLMQQTGMCEAAGHFIKEVQRMKKEVTKELSRMSRNFDEDTLTPWTEALAALDELEADPFGDVDMDFFDPRDLFEQLEEIRFYLDDARRELGDRRSSQKFEEGYSQMISEISSFVKGATGECRALGEKALSRLKSAQKANEDFGDVMSDLERVKERGDALGCFDDFEGGQDFENGEDFGGFGLDTGDLLGEEIDEELLAKLEERILSKLDNAVKLATAALESQLTEALSKLATLEDNFQNAVTAAVETALSNSIYFNKDVQEAVMNSRGEIATVVQEIGEIDLPSNVDSVVEQIAELTLKENLTADAVDEVKQQLDAFATLAASEDDSKVLREEALALQVEVQKIVAGDIPEQVEQGFRAFEDAAPSDWYGGYAAAAKESGVIKGAKDGTALEPGRAINRCEAMAVVVRQDNDGAEPQGGKPTDLPAGAPEWCHPYLNYMEDNHPEVYAQLKDEAFNEGMTRGETAFVFGQVFNDQLDSGSVATVNQSVTDGAGIPEEFKDEVATMMANGIMTGREREDGAAFEFDGSLTRAEFAKVMTVTQEVAGE